jgi:hypothetical protein
LQKTNVKYGIFVQNGFFLHTKPSNKFNDHEIHKAYEKAKIIISYSDEITECIKLNFPSVIDKILRIGVSVDSKKFQCDDEVYKNKENLITYMPRKKKDHAGRLMFILDKHLPKNWKIKSLDNLKEIEVIEFLKKSKIFLSFSELEGFGLPPVEAALCGNHVVGYTGESGKEYWHSPIFDEIFSGDIRKFAKITIEKIQLLNNNNQYFKELSSHIKDLADKYSIEKETLSLNKLVNKIKNL